MLFGCERNLGFGKVAVRRLAGGAKAFQFGGESGDLVLKSLFARFGVGGLRDEGGAFFEAFLVVRGQGFEFVSDGLNLLAKNLKGAFEHFEFAFLGGDGDFLGA